MKRERFSITQRLRSFKYAFKGLITMFSGEYNARIHLLAAAIVIAGGIVFSVSLFSWVLLVLAIGLVFIAELINTSLEHLADVVSPEKNEKIKKAKDLAAAAVLVSVIMAVVIGLVVFLPLLLEFFAE
ncbi:MAG: diacylglycerol kinase family protein [Bacteroidales bacterium]|nr:diacylglycerol kinase family protein [Bacteroidales bacterium]